MKAKGIGYGAIIFLIVAGVLWIFSPGGEGWICTSGDDCRGGLVCSGFVFEKDYKATQRVCVKSGTSGVSTRDTYWWPTVLFIWAIPVAICVGVWRDARKRRTTRV